jgi:hypothetical protein
MAEMIYLHEHLLGVVSSTTFSFSKSPRALLYVVDI